jgi:hypothetical protein
MHRFSSLGRPIDRRYATNRAVASLTLLVAVASFLVLRLSGEPPPASFLRAVSLAVGFFLAWAIARELDPDHGASAFVAAGLSLIPLAMLGRPDYAAVFLVLLILRIVNRTVGPAARPLDTIAILALAGVAAWRGNPLIVAAAATAFALDGILRPDHRIHLVAAGAAFGLVAVAGTHLAGGLPGPDVISGLGLGATLPFLILIKGSGDPLSVSDDGGGRLSATRVRSAQWLGFLLFAALVVGSGRAGWSAVSPLWAALAGTGLFSLTGALTSIRH